MKTCCFLGYGQLPLGEDYVRLYISVAGHINALIKRGVTDFISCGLPGLDSLAAHAVLNLRRINSIRLLLYLPYERYNRYVNKQANQIKYTLKDARHCRYEMIDASDFCICCLGTAAAGDVTEEIRYAESKGVEVIVIKVKDTII